MAIDVCGDGIDQNCDGVPDNDPSCDPFKQNQVTVGVTAQSFSAGSPLIAFKEGGIKSGQLKAGPDRFSVNIPLRGMNLSLELAGARLSMDLSDAGGKTNASNGLLGGVLQALTLQQISGIEASGVIKKDQSLLDAIFAGSAIAPILGLDSDLDGHYLPDIDVDGDGIETFYNSTGLTTAGGSLVVDTCKDGDGTIVMSTADVPCVTAKDSKGNYRFVDGLSAALRFTAVPVKLDGTLIQ
jgi:hypothetical protein